MRKVSYNKSYNKKCDIFAIIGTYYESLGKKCNIL